LVFILIDKITILKIIIVKNDTIIKKIFIQFHNLKLDFPKQI